MKTILIKLALLIAFTNLIGPNLVAAAPNLLNRSDKTLTVQDASAQDETELSEGLCDAEQTDKDQELVNDTIIYLNSLEPLIDELALQVKAGKPLTHEQEGQLLSYIKEMERLRALLTKIKVCGDGLEAEALTLIIQAQLNDIQNMIYRIETTFFPQTDPNRPRRED